MILILWEDSCYYNCSRKSGKTLDDKNKAIGKIHFEEFYPKVQHNGKTFCELIWVYFGDSFMSRKSGETVKSVTAITFTQEKSPLNMMDQVMGHLDQVNSITWVSKLKGPANRLQQNGTFKELLPRFSDGATLGKSVFSGQP